MEEIIDSYVSETFSSELQDQIRRSFSLFDAFEFRDVEGNYLDILATASYQNASDIQDLFINELNRKLDHLLLEHTLKLTSEATIFEKNEILTAILFLQMLEDSSAVITLLESLEPDDEILSIILSDHSMLEQTQVMTLISEFDPIFLKTLKNYIYNQESQRALDTTEDFLKVKDNLVYFLKYFKENTLAFQLVKAEVFIGASFVDYMRFIAKETLSGTDDEVAMNLLSILMMSIDGYNSPLLVYRKYSDKLFKDLNRISVIEGILIAKLSEFNEYRKQALLADKVRTNNG